MLYVLAGSGLVALVSGGVAWYFYQRARADRADRDAALTRAAAAGDLAARLQGALNTMGANAKAAYDQAAQDGAKVGVNPAGAASFLRDSSLHSPDPGVLPPHPTKSAARQLPATARAHSPRFVSGFGRGRTGDLDAL